VFRSLIEPRSIEDTKEAVVAWVEEVKKRDLVPKEVEEEAESTLTHNLEKSGDVTLQKVKARKPQVTGDTPEAWLKVLAAL